MTNYYQNNNYGQPQTVGPLTAIKDCFRGIFDFKGRTTRAGFWWAIVGLIVLLMSLSALAVITIMTLVHSSGDPHSQFSGLEKLFFSGFAVFILAIVLLVPIIALTIRRYRDAGLRGRGSLVLILGYLVVMTLITQYNSMGVQNGTFDEDSLVNFFGRPFNSFLLLFFALLAVFPTDFLTTTSPNKFVQFFLRSKQPQVAF